MEGLSSKNTELKLMVTAKGKEMVNRDARYFTKKCNNDFHRHPKLFISNQENTVDIPSATKDLNNFF